MLPRQCENRFPSPTQLRLYSRRRRRCNPQRQNTQAPRPSLNNTRQFTAARSPLLLATGPGARASGISQQPRMRAHIPCELAQLPASWWLAPALLLLLDTAPDTDTNFHYHDTNTNDLRPQILLATS